MKMPSIIEIPNGTPVKGTFSDAEYESRLSRLRAHMAANDLDAVLFTSYHNICYYSDFLYCKFGRNYGLVVDHDGITSVSANIDGGQPWRRTYGARNVVYTDWQRDNYFRALQDLIRDGGTVGIEFDHVNLQNRDKLQAALPAASFVDISSAVMRLPAIFLRR